MFSSNTSSCATIASAFASGRLFVSPATVFVSPAAVVLLSVPVDVVGSPEVSIRLA